MLTIILLAIVAAAVAGLTVRAVLRFRNSEYEISWREYAIGMIIISLAVSPLVGWAGWKLAQNSNLTFNEYWNGWETSAVKQEITCTRDGPCAWEYDCDPYRCNPHDCNCVCVSRDDKGNCTSQSCDTCYDTCYHDCPYVTREYTFIAETTLGGYTIAANVFPVNPDSYRWRSGVRVPESVIQRAGTGEPPFWVAVRDRCQAGQPGPVTARRTYENYILASDRTILKQYSADVEEFRKNGELPAIQKGMQAFYHADKVHFVGARPSNAPLWQNALEYFNARLGSELQGDLQVVLVRNDTIAANPDRYALALKAYWQNTQVFGHDVTSKNGIVVVIGTSDGQTVAWSRAFTGMPLGNEKLLVTLRDGLKGQPFSPDALIGPAQSYKNGAKVVRPVEIQPGALERVLWGMDDPSTRFARVSMKGDNGQGGFLYLKNEIQLSAGQKWGVFIFTLIACLVVWVVFALRPERGESGFRSRR